MDFDRELREEGGVSAPIASAKLAGALRIFGMRAVRALVSRFAALAEGIDIIRDSYFHRFRWGLLSVGNVNVTYA